MKNEILLSSILLSMSAGTALAGGKKGDIKCYGVAKAGQNDCGSKDGAHGCSGKAKKDFDKNEWKYLDKATCAKEQAALKGTDAKKKIDKKLEKIEKKIEKKVKK